MFSVQTSNGGGVHRVRLVGEFDLAAVEEARSALISPGHRGADLEIDLRPLTFIDSSGVGVLVAVCQDNERSARTIRIIQASEGVQRVFEILGLAERLPFSPSGRSIGSSRYLRGLRAKTFRM